MSARYIDLPCVPTNRCCFSSCITKSCTAADVRPLLNGSQVFPWSNEIYTPWSFPTYKISSLTLSSITTLIGESGRLELIDCHVLP